MCPLNLIAITTIAAVIAVAPASAGPEMPMYQFPQSKQMSMLPQPSPRPRDVACTPATAPALKGEATTVATLWASSGNVRYHVVDGKCVPVGGN